MEGRNMNDCEPNLGCATTRQLLEEIKCRGEMAAYTEGGGYPEERDMGIGAANLLESLPGSVLDQRTVDDG